MANTIKEILNFVINNKELLAIVLSPVIAVAIGEWLRVRNYNKQHREDNLRRLISYAYQLSPYQANKEEIIKALNETKYWYSGNRSINLKIHKLWNLMAERKDAQDSFIDLIQSIGKREGHSLSRNDIEKVFSARS